MDDTNQNISPDFSDDTVRRFLLGQLSANEQPGFEQRLFLDSELETRVRLAELDLADDYAFSRLRVEDRERFEQRFLLSDDRKLKLNVSNALRERFALTQAPARTTTRFVEQFQSLFNSHQLIVKIGVGVAMLVVIVGSGWLLKKEQPRITEGIKEGIKESIRKVAKIRRPKPSNTPPEAHHPRGNSVPQYREMPSPIVETITLSPNMLLESGMAPSINLPAGARDIVRLELVVVKPEPSTLYLAQLSTIDGQIVVTAESLKATDFAGEKINFDVPAGLLKTGDYRITLRSVSDTSTENEANYYFRVR